MTALTLVVAALGGGLLATVLGEWLRNRREYEEARLLVISEILTMLQLARNVAVGRLDRNWFAAAAIHNEAWLTFRVRLIRRLYKDPGHGQLDGLYAALDLFRRDPERADIQGLITSLELAAAVLNRMHLRRIPLLPGSG